MCNIDVASADIEKMVSAYLHCAIWTSPCEDEGVTLDYYDADDFSDDTKERMKLEIQLFITTNNALVLRALAEYPHSPANDMCRYSSFGHDLYLTSNGHGAGFWDRVYLKVDNLGELLTTACKALRECNAVLGDDGSLYLE